MLGNRHSNSCNIDLLKGILSKKRQRHIAGDRNHGNRIHVGRCNAGNQIGGSGAGGCHADSDLAGCTGISIRSMCRSLLVACQNVANLIAVLIEGIVNI